MNRSTFAAALAITAFGVGAASAADLAPYTKAPVMVQPLYNWAGLYVGGHIGGSWSDQVWTNTANTTAFGDLARGQGFGQHGSGVFGGGQIGYNWQASNFVFGLEGTISGLNNAGTVINRVFGAADDVFTWRSNWMATVTGRTGITANNNLFYVKGGYAGISEHLGVTDVVAPFTGAGSSTAWHNGWTVGAGWEYGLTRNWIVGVEYDYAAFETHGYGLGGAAGIYNFDLKPRDVQSAVARLSYKFSGPLVAKY
jgi:outer membrane immunogenic protein